MKKILLIIFMLLMSTNIISCATVSYSYNDNGTGTFTAVNKHLEYDPCGHYLYHHWLYYYKDHNTWDINKWTGTTWTLYWRNTVREGPYYHYLYKTHAWTDPQPDDYYLTLIVSETPIYKYNVSGITSCVNLIELYQKDNNGNYNIINTSTSSHYKFPIHNQQEYKLVFNDGHEYEFSCNGSDVQYDYDACNYGIINLYDNCANLLINPFIVVYNLDDNMNIVYSGHDNPVTFLPSDVDENDELDVIWSTWQGTFQKRCFAQFDQPINLYDQSIYWNLGIHVWDENVNRCSNALTIFDQDCIINGYPKRNGFTDSDGYVEFTQCENDNGNLTVDKTEYKSLNVEVVNTFDAQTKNYGINVFLEPDNSSEESNWTAVNDSWNDTNVTEEPSEISEGVEYTMLLYFKNQEGHRISSVLNNTSYVRCFYAIKYPAPVNMQLDFERSVNGLGYTVLYTYPYSIDNNSCGYMWINNTYFNDPDYIYRAHIYDQTDEHIGRHAYLRVVAAPEEQNYTAYAIFSPNEPLIDYREYIKGKVFANATSGSLPNLSVELYNEDTLIEYFNYTPSDFDSYGWAYWLLGYNYTLHHNYTLLLKNDVGDIVSTAYTYAEDMRGNRLTVKVVDPSGNPLDHSYIFLKDYGRIPTNEQSYATFEGLANQDYYYKAEKGGYRSTGWDMVSPVDEDTQVTYTLIPESPVYQNRMAKTDVKTLYYPFMYILLIIMLVGGLIHVFN